MASKLPDGITRDHLLEAIADIDRNVPNRFFDSTGYDVLHEGRRYPPKAVVGVAAGKLLGAPLGPGDFKGGRGSKCFRILDKHKFEVVTKGDTEAFPDELNEKDVFIEGAAQRVLVNRYERDVHARRKSLEHHGLSCLVCDFNFEKAYGAIGEGFIHVHHVMPLADIGESYVVDPINDLTPVCPNCHAMLHKRSPPFTIVELRTVVMGLKR